MSWSVMECHDIGHRNVDHWFLSLFFFISRIFSDLRLLSWTVC